MPDKESPYCSFALSKRLIGDILESCESYIPENNPSLPVSNMLYLAGEEYEKISRLMDSAPQENTEPFFSLSPNLRYFAREEIYQAAWKKMLRKAY